MTRKAVFFDRDGVLNHALVVNGKCYPPENASTLNIVAGARQSLNLLKAEGYICLCVTNQPDWARGNRTLDNIHKMNAKVLSELPLDDLFVCLHDNSHNCDCRKPKPGMLQEAAAKWRLDLNACWMVGDRKSDIEAGHAAGCRTIFIDQGYDTPDVVLPTATCTCIASAVQIIINAKEKSNDYV